MKRKRFLAILLFLAFSVQFLGGCSFSLAFAGTTKKASMSAKFTYLKGTKSKTIRLKDGDVLILDYDVSLKKGTLVIALEGPQGDTKKEEIVEEDKKGQFVVTSSGDSKYAVKITGDWATGSYDVRWTFEPVD